MPEKPILLDGRTGEGGGQLVRLAVCLASLTGHPVKITNVRGNRTGSRGGDAKGGGLKSQHVTAISWLSHATNAQVEGLSVGSHTLTFIPRTSPTELGERKIRIAAEQNAASTLLILQAILPFLLFAANDSNEAIEVEINGGTNVSFSLSYEYLDQVLLPTLQERFGTVIERRLVRRGWSQGPKSRDGGQIWLRIQPLGRGEKLKFTHPSWRTASIKERYEVKTVDVTMIVPSECHQTLQRALVRDLETAIGEAEIRFHTIEDSGHESRWYILLVAKSACGIRWAKDALTSMGKKVKAKDTFVSTLSQSLCRDLAKETMLEGEVDEHLHDQMIVFQALADGVSALEREGGSDGLEAGIQEVEGWDKRQRIMKRIRVDEPAGNGSLHARTVRWVVSEMLSNAMFFRQGDVVDGAGICFN